MLLSLLQCLILMLKSLILRLCLVKLGNRRAQLLLSDDLAIELKSLEDDRLWLTLRSVLKAIH